MERNQIEGKFHFQSVFRCCSVQKFEPFKLCSLNCVVIRVRGSKIGKYCSRFGAKLAESNSIELKSFSKRSICRYIFPLSIHLYLRVVLDVFLPVLINIVKVVA